MLQILHLKEHFPTLTGFLRSPWDTLTLVMWPPLFTRDSLWPHTSQNGIFLPAWWWVSQSQIPILLPVFVDKSWIFWETETKMRLHMQQMCIWKWQSRTTIRKSKEARRAFGYHVGFTSVKKREREGDWVVCSRVPKQVQPGWRGVLEPKSLVGGVSCLTGTELH